MNAQERQQRRQDALRLSRTQQRRGLLERMAQVEIARRLQAELAERQRQQQGR